MGRKKGREALSGQCEVEVPWRTRLPGWLSDEQGSVKGWGRTFPQPSILQSASQCCNAEAQTAISSYTRKPFLSTFFFLSFLSHLFLIRHYSNVFSLYVCSCMCVVFFSPCEPKCSDIILSKIKLSSLCVWTLRRISLAFQWPSPVFLLVVSLHSLSYCIWLQSPCCSVVMKPVLEEQHRRAFGGPAHLGETERGVNIDLILFPWT